MLEESWFWGLLSDEAATLDVNAWRSWEGEGEDGRGVIDMWLVAGGNSF